MRKFTEWMVQREEYVPANHQLNQDLVNRTKNVVNKAISILSNQPRLQEDDKKVFQSLQLVLEKINKGENPYIYFPDMSFSRRRTWSFGEEIANLKQEWFKSYHNYHVKERSSVDAIKKMIEIFKPFLQKDQSGEGILRALEQNPYDLHNWRAALDLAEELGVPNIEQKRKFLQNVLNDKTP